MEVAEIEFVISVLIETRIKLEKEVTEKSKIIYSASGKTKAEAIDKAISVITEFGSAGIYEESLTDEENKRADEFIKKLKNG